MNKTEVLINALHRIANEQLELSHEKVHLQIRDWRKIAEKALEEYYSD